MIRKIGLGLIVFSIILLIFYFVYQVGIEKKNESDVLEYIKNTSVEEKISNGNVIDESKEELDNKTSINYTAILEIPSINLKRGVVDSTKNFDSINYAISVDDRSEYPDKTGNFILYAHSGNSPIAFFNNLTNVELNDDVYVYYNGIKYHYIIKDKYDIEKTGKANVISSNEERYITLITCNPKRVGYQVVIVGQLIDKISY